MSNIINTIQFISSLKELVQTYEQIHLLKINKTRTNVLKSREYITGMSVIFSEIKLAHLKTQTSLPTTQNKDVAILFTAKQKFSGDINPKIYKKFTDFISKNSQTDIIIIGPYGKSRFEGSPLKKEYQYFDIDENKDQIDLDALKPITNKLLGYQRVHIFHGQFVNFLKQIETVSYLPQPDNDNNNLQAFIFEPTLTSLISHFENNILSSLFKQTAQESHLAQIGSRIQALEQAQKNISDYLISLQIQKRRALRRKRNKKQLATLSGMSLWDNYQPLY